MKSGKNALVLISLALILASLIPSSSLASEYYDENGQLVVDTTDMPETSSPIVDDSISGKLLNPGFYIDKGTQTWDTVKQTRSLAASWIDNSFVGDFTVGNFLTWLGVIIVILFLLFVIFRFWMIFLVLAILLVVFLVIMGYFGSVGIIF